ncbi:MAG: HAD-IC family P-type ATPase [Sphingomonadaceae bacterium]|uniref:cation-translocating P-type ATPase n=1 Tax=Thermaurantiacus sp. TaxID=2820283 RepID=UPI00298EF642|nr:HAD-IC family P-type ATPase [Thermaurantiacus sp.]MCS6986948.1 HAD-IC family P-type ATPase [Sphingomonadaceae bacterium]MDW8415452.1 HAD-IC family P-type ATPase [Thermaurantiacus sp.]
MAERPGDPPTTDPPVHALDSAAVLARFAVTPEGLSAAEAAARLARFGPNRLPARRRDGPLRRLWRQFDNPLVTFLVVAALVAAALGEGADALVIAAVVAINAGIGFLQEGRAEDALAAIRAMMDPVATVRREGQRTVIPAAEVVPGDIVLIEAGDRVPADLRLTEARALRVDEAALTGESVPVAKSTAPVGPGVPLAERTGMAYAGTLVAAGTGVGVVTATGAGTELGRISALMAEVGETRTPLVRQMDRFARRLTAVVLGLSGLAFLLAVGPRGMAAGEAFMLVVGIAVAAIPEGLPAVLTVTLAIGVRRMAERKALIRRLPAVETLGSVGVICTDKTGTLTANEMTVVHLELPGGARSVSGAGYAPTGRIEGGVDAEVRALALAGALAGDAELRLLDGVWQVVGDPMEGALLALARKAGVEAERVAARRSDVRPFSSEARLMATLDVRADGRTWVAVKGAPEAVLARCDLTSADRARWLARAEALAARGLRVLAIAEAEAQALEPLAGLRLLGLAGFLDPPRPEAASAVATCRQAGIRVVMVTGDHAATAAAVARAVGLAHEPGVMTGAELDAVDDAALDARLDRLHVFARTAPEHKLRLVDAFRRRGQVVAMTGDGVNDAPALKRADIGIAMGRKGTEAARDAADMVLADDNFASIAAAVREGRTVWDNLMKVIGWTLPTNGGEALTIMAALAFGLVLPLSAIQILWINMVTAVTLGLALAFEPGEDGAMRRPPRDPAAPILSGRLLWRIAFVSVLVALFAFLLFDGALAAGRPVETARTLVVNAIVAMEMFYLFAVRFTHGTGLAWQGVKGTPAVWWAIGIVAIAQLALTHAPPLQAVFSTRALGPVEWLAALGAGLILLLVVEAEKALGRAWARRQVPQKVA